MQRAMQQQLAVGLMLGAGLAAGGWVRVYLTNGNALNATAISISLFLIVLCSVVAGTGAHGQGVLRECNCCCLHNGASPDAWPSCLPASCTEEAYCVSS